MGKKYKRRSNDDREEQSNESRDRGTPEQTSLQGRSLRHEEFEFMYGDIVEDEEAENDPEKLVVANVTDEKANEWFVTENTTLADQNPSCPDDDDVIVTVEYDALQVSFPDWKEREEDIPLERLEDEEVPYTTYPALRLDLIQGSHLRS